MASSARSSASTSHPSTDPRWVRRSPSRPSARPTTRPRTWWTRQLTSLSNGMIVLTFAADPISDSVPIGTPVDTTGFEIYASLIHPGDPLIPVTAVQVSDVAGDNPAYDQRHPDVVGIGTNLRFVWEGDSDTTGGEDGKSDIWTALLPDSLGGGAISQRVSIRHDSGTEFDNTRPRVSANPSATEVVWEGVDTVTDGIPVRRIWGARISSFPDSPRLIGSLSTDGNLEETSPDVVWDASSGFYNVVWSGDTGGAGVAGDTRIWQRWVFSSGNTTRVGQRPDRRQHPRHAPLTGAGRGPRPVRACLGRTRPDRQRPRAPRALHRPMEPQPGDAHADQARAGPAEHRRRRRLGRQRRSPASRTSTTTQAARPSTPPGPATPSPVAPASPAG